LIAQSGFDGTAEEMYFAIGKAALERGYNVLLFEGPGQTGKRRFHPDSSFVPDCAPALRAVVDFALARPEVHPAKIALYGASFGGYFALSGAVGEPRLGAVIANSPLIDAQEHFFAGMGPQFVGMFQNQNLTAEEIRAMPDEELPAKYKFSLLSLCVRYGKPSVKETLDVMRDFRLRDDQLRSLNMPALGLVGEAEGRIPLAQAKRFAELAPKAALHIFTEESGANIHCQLDNMPLSWAVALDWLDEQFR
jgi:pimeloyl-ACP methyl ester carboxylesterase